jgi:predicted metal-dependent hydrolase
MDWTGLAALLGVLGTVIWLGFDKVQASKTNSGQFAENLAATAQKLVDTAQDVYQSQITDLKSELIELRKRVAHLEGQLHAYQRCPYPGCPMRKLE